MSLSGLAEMSESRSSRGTRYLSDERGSSRAKRAGATLASAATRVAKEAAAHGKDTTRVFPPT